MNSAYDLLKHLAGPALKPFWRGNLSGIHHVPENGPCIVVANHASYADFFLLASVFEMALGRRLYFWAKSKVLRHPLLGFFARIGECIEVTPTGSRERLWEESRAYMRQGRFVGIFPEGTRSRSGKLARFHRGYLRLACETGAPILPVLLHGTRDILPPGAGLPRPGKVRMEFHEPVRLSPSGTKDGLHELNDRIWTSIFRANLDQA